MQLAREFRKQECCSGTEAALHSGAISAAGGDLISTGFRLIISRSASGSPESSLVKISSTSTVLRRIKGHKIAQKNCIQESNVSYRQLTRGIRKPVARDSVLASGACAVRAPGRLPWKDGRPAKAHRGLHVLAANRSFTSVRYEKGMKQRRQNGRRHEGFPRPETSAGGGITVAALFVAALGTVWTISSPEQRAAALSLASGLAAAMGLIRDAA